MSHLAKAQKLLDMTRSALELAKASEWEKVSDTEEQRQRLVREVFAQPVPEDEAQAVRECIEQVLEINTALIRLGQAEKQAIVQAMRQARQGQQAHRAYNEV